MANIIIPDGGTIGSTSDTDAIAISSGGNVTLSQTLDGGAIGSAVTMSANQACVKTALNASGNPPIYACRAWVNFRGTTQSGTATASGLVSGQYTATVTSTTQFTVVYSSTTYTINTTGNHDIAGGVVGQSEGVDLTVSGTSVTIDTQIRGSGNVSSITDNGIGKYTVNFTSAMPDANYSFFGACGTYSRVFAGGATPTTSSCQMWVSISTSGTLEDNTFMYAGFFR